MVRLGALKIDSPTASDHEIKNFIKHEGFKRKHKVNDIALVELVATIVFDNPASIRPACLLQTVSVTQEKVIATGFGVIEYSGKASRNLLKVKLDVLETSYCVNYFKETPNVIMNSNQICAGVLTGGRDTCQGGE